MTVKNELLDRLSKLAPDLDSIAKWPAEQLQLCAKYDVFKWFVSEQYGGIGSSPQEIVQGYIQLASACLTTAFVITQRTAACKRIALSENKGIKDALLPKLAHGEVFATVGISHLTTSHRHLAKPVLTATCTNTGWLLNGFSPWVTGAANADFFVAGAVTESGDQILLAIDSSADGLVFPDPFPTIALPASQTGKVEFHCVEVANEMLIAGPTPNVLKSGPAASTGGLQTSALAIGLATSAVEFVAGQPKERVNLIPNARALRHELDRLRFNIVSLASGELVCSSEQLRIEVNSFVLRATQSALIAAKGAGFVDGHPAGRWCREALFFLVWSCPQVVSDANLCEFAGIAE